MFIFRAAALHTKRNMNMVVILTLYALALTLSNCVYVKLSPSVIHLQDAPHHMSSFDPLYMPSYS